MANLVLTEVSKNKCYGGFQLVYSHQSVEVKCKMTFAVYLPPQADSSGDVKLPVIYWLSGLTCTEQNFIQKSGIQKYAAEHGVIIVGPDTSPRGCNIDGESERWDFGAGAGFYLNATQDKWKENYRMYSYVTSELVAVAEKNFPVDTSRQSIMGHSMGGHGALICYLKNPGKYRSVSAFAPISNPTMCSFGKFAFAGYLGDDKKTWEAYDACHLVKSYSGPLADILIDQGKADEFLKAEQLLPENFVSACAESKVPVILRMQEGYDHSYYFISTFMSDHVAHHAKYLKA